MTLYNAQFIDMLLSHQMTGKNVVTQKLANTKKYENFVTIHQGERKNIVNMQTHCAEKEVEMSCRDRRRTGILTVREDVSFLLFRSFYEVNNSRLENTLSNIT